MQRLNLPILLLASLALAACGGGIQAGDDCTGEGTGQCSSDTSALVCQSGTFAEFPCKGEDGCTESDGSFSCAVQAVAGDACPASVKGKGTCNPENANQWLACVDGIWEAGTCNGCHIDAGQVMCFQ